jgi:hypothetical protein
MQRRCAALRITAVMRKIKKKDLIAILTGIPTSIRHVSSRNCWNITQRHIEYGRRAAPGIWEFI